MQAPSGERKSVLAAVFTALAVTGWILIYMKKFGMLFCLYPSPLSLSLVLGLFNASDEIQSEIQTMGNHVKGCMATENMSVHNSTNVKN